MARRSQGHDPFTCTSTSCGSRSWKGPVVSGRRPAATSVGVDGARLRIYISCRGRVRLHRFQRTCLWQTRCRFGTCLSGFTCQKRIPVNIEEPRLLFTSRFPESVIRLTDLNVHEAGVRQHPPPAFARKAAGDSSRPEINIAYRTLGHRLAISDIAKLQSTSGSQHSR